MTWVQWLQNIVNLMKLVELGAFIFSAYQFWAGRRDRIDANDHAWQVINSAQGKWGNGGRTAPILVAPYWSPRI